MNILILYLTQEEYEKSIEIQEEMCKECPNFNIEVLNIKYIDSIDIKDYDHIICILPLPILIRKISCKLVDKLVDPSITLISPDLKFVIPICGEHTKLGFDIASMLLNLLGRESILVTTCREHISYCIEYMISKLKLCIDYACLDNLKKFLVKSNLSLHKIYINDCIKIKKIITYYFNNVKLVNDYSISDVVILSSNDEYYHNYEKKLVLRYIVTELSISNRLRVSTYTIHRAALCFLTVPERFDIIKIDSNISEFSLKQYFIR